jgi:hypothetical protein
MKKLIFISLLILSCSKEERDHYICQNLTIQSIRNKPNIKPDSTSFSTYHFLTMEECIILKDINTYSAVGLLYGDTIDIRYETKCKLSY